MIPYGRQDITQTDVDAVCETLLGDFITQGPKIAEFENVIADTCDVTHAIAVSSATAALHIAYLALDLGPGDLLWTSPNTFVATSNAALYCGASVDFIDIDPDTYVMCLDTLEARLKAAAKTRALPKVVVPVHFAGQSCDMERLGALADTYGFRVVEDASHAIGGSYRGAPVGNCAHSDICVFSFHPVKIVTTAEGGVATTRDPDLATRLTELRSHGITRDPARMLGQSHGPWYYEQISLGYNYRITDLQAALGVSQMSRLADYTAARHARRKVYDQALADLPVKLPHQPNFQHSGLHLYPVLLRDEAPVNREVAFDQLRALGIGVNVLYIPVYLQPYYAKLGFEAGLCPVAEDYYARMLALPMYAKLTEEEQSTVVAAMHRVLG
ncbi:UDP-4-amino-4,6-dideoxy-N-acetyl-beta-L-altrosamine transaminase [Phycobacter azelaicus]|uniref:UDP-4-amino-4, 6-dideoxy-N-acetyl-beta-L-altrosamine transaminase n=1 Tax=Phycobacter azelaicus TaxID=2668075 RepID=UPI0018660497|nr:UDP-4-amino-4,6-dideoxy-N-acetyl-beta-L-altrosamine transaminase [Phycobacter azelaicus]MBE1294808.1 UDP-4-amino-4,6-dideoxy-N-acetyl-beta-L-altrosamine transaminase [Paracoccaceae bacterium]